MVLVTVTALGDLWSHQLMLSPMPVCPFYDKVVLAVVGCFGGGALLYTLYVFCCGLETRSSVPLTLGILGKDREFACGTENYQSGQNSSTWHYL